MFSIKISNTVTVQLEFASNAAAVQDRLDEAFETVMVEFRNRDAYRRASIDAATKGALLLKATLDKQRHRPYYHIMYAAAAIEGRSRTSAGEPTTRYFQYRCIARTAAHAAAVRNRFSLFPSSPYRRRRSHSSPE